MFGFMLGAQKKARVAMEKVNAEETTAAAFADDMMSDDELDGDSDTEEQLAMKMQKELYWKLQWNKFLGFFGIESSEDKVAGEGSPEYPDEYYYKSEFHQDKNIVVRSYLDYVALPSFWMINNENFNNTIIFVIIIAGINVGVQTYPATDDLLFFVVLDYLILTAFIIEFLFKVCAEGLRPFRYFVGPEWAWNQFDFIIIVLSLPMWDFLFKGGNSVAMLRLIRLARLGKLIKKIPPLQMIMSGLIGGLSSIGYILLLLFLVFYLYGIIGFYLYSVGDPFHFGSLPMSLLILFRISLLENWSDVMYVNIFGCDEYLNVYVTPDQKTPDNKLFWCDHPEKHAYDAPIFFISFVVISAFVMLSLFIGAITMSMSESMEELKETTAKKKKQALFEKNAAKMQLLAKKVIEGGRGEGGGAGSTSVGGGGKVSPQISTENLQKSKSSSGNGYSLLKYFGFGENSEDEELTDRIAELLKTALGDIDGEKDSNTAAESPGESNEVAVTSMQSKFWTGYFKLGDYCAMIVEHPYFNNSMTAIIILAGFNVGAQTDLRLQRMQTVVDVLYIMDVIILIFFTAEVVLKILALKAKPLLYFKSNWNNFDFLIVVGSYVPAVGSAVTVLRLLRLLRVLKLVKRMPQLAVIINALINGLSSIGYIGVILFLVFYVFAILGIILFSENDPWHFATLHVALISLFRTSTLDNVTAVMFTSMFGCDLGGLADVYGDYPDQCTKPSRILVLTCIYYVVFVIIAAQILLTLFIGVISTSMDEARELKDKEMEVDREVRKYAALRGLTNAQVESFEQVFELLDIENEGVLMVKDFQIAVAAIDMDISEDEIVSIMYKIDPESSHDGLTIVGFMKFMFLTPKYKDGAAAARLKYLLNLKQERINKPKPFITIVHDWLKSNFPFIERDDTEAQHEAALVLQDLWRTRKAKREALEIVVKKKESNGPIPSKKKSFIRGGKLDGNSSDDEKRSTSSHESYNSSSRRQSFKNAPSSSC